MLKEIKAVPCSWCACLDRACISRAGVDAHQADTAVLSAEDFVDHCALKAGGVRCNRDTLLLFLHLDLELRGQTQSRRSAHRSHGRRQWQLSVSCSS